MEKEWHFREGRVSVCGGWELAGAGTVNGGGPGARGCEERAAGSPGHDP